MLNFGGTKKMDLWTQHEGGSKSKMIDRRLGFVNKIQTFVTLF